MVEDRLSSNRVSNFRGEPTISRYLDTPVAPHSAHFAAFLYTQLRLLTLSFSVLVAWDAQQGDHRGCHRGWHDSFRTNLGLLSDRCLRNARRPSTTSSRLTRTGNHQGIARARARANNLCLTTQKATRVVRSVFHGVTDDR